MLTHPRTATETFTASHPFGLTPREDQMLRLMANGLSAKEISHTIGISHRTIGVHCERALAKMSARNRAHAVAIGFASGLLTARDLELDENQESGE